MTSRLKGGQLTLFDCVSDVPGGQSSSGASLSLSAVKKPKQTDANDSSTKSDGNFELEQDHSSTDEMTEARDQFGGLPGNRQTEITKNKPHGTTTYTVVKNTGTAGCPWFTFELHYEI